MTAPKTTTTTTTTVTTQIDRTKIDLTVPVQGQRQEKDQEKKEKEKSQPEDTVIETDTDTDRTSSDREYLEQIMACGDVRRKIERLESTASSETETTESPPSVAPKYIGDNVPVVKEVVQSIEDKFCGTVVSAIPFPVQKRPPHEDGQEPDVAEVEKQILTPADLALEQLIKWELPPEVVKLSPIEATAAGLQEIQEEVCEKICQKRKAFEVAEDLSETEKTLPEQELGLDKKVEQVPGAGKILTESLDQHIDLVGKEPLEALPKVREVVQDIERRYPTASLEAKPFSPRKRIAQERQADVSSIEQQILDDTDMILEGLGSKRIPEQKVVSPVLASSKQSPSIENLEDVCEKTCSKRTISVMAKAFEKQPEIEPLPEVDDIKSTTAKFLERETISYDVAESIKEFEAKSVVQECLTGAAEKRLHSISKTDIEDTKQFVHAVGGYEEKLTNIIEHDEQARAQADSQNLEKETTDRFPIHDKTVELQTHQNLVLKTPEIPQSLNPL
ncbi:uncharacterized abhydrolase domain-containing protein DDB_G0269086-like [Drosophila guanche]|uniref:uncharacterized abhydrolase domain-containing protein DDB_G0269086-like n=1 Tax=Drosophila guanche TaxID=7266 RepID=UPI0014709060|nr:uncharacterized abhydrolase domain-containing protein DDB_G0269086-like [Drosophila guanche]